MKLRTGSISKKLDITNRQVQNSLEKQALTPTKRPGRLLSLSSDQIDKLKYLSTSSRTVRQMSHLELAMA